MFKIFFNLTLMLLVLLFGAYTDGENQDPVEQTPTTPTVTCLGDDTNIDADVPDWIRNNFNCITASMSGTDIVISTDSLPNHSSPYWGTGDENYEDIPAGNTQLIPSFTAQSYTMTIPETPTARVTPFSMYAGAVGVSVNGVVMFKGQTSTSASLSTELSTFDGAQGHPNGGQFVYHYHNENAYLTNYQTSLNGIMNDGYPIYGSLEEDGSTPGDTTPALDTMTYGHTHSTTDFPSGTFHYHLTAWDGGLSVAIMPLYFHGQASPSDVTGP